MKPIKCLLGKHNNIKHILQTRLTGYNYVPYERRNDDAFAASFEVVSYQWVCSRCGRKSEVIHV